MKSKPSLLLFAKTPILGNVKTRLRPQCSEKQCLELAKILLEDSIVKAVDCWEGKVVLSVWPELKDDFIQQMSQKYPIELTLQADGDLGDKMSAAFTEFGYPMAIMGCDAPHIAQKTLTACYSYLTQRKNCLGESEDGGYYIIGLSKQCSEIFQGVEWGSESVFTSTMQRAKRQLLELKQLPILNDVDTWQDLVEASDHLPNIVNYLKQQKPI